MSERHANWKRDIGKAKWKKKWTSCRLSGGSTVKKKRPEKPGIDQANIGEMRTGRSTSTVILVRLGAGAEATAHVARKAGSYPPFIGNVLSASKSIQDGLHLMEIRLTRIVRE
jgi:hypothetical protein